MKNWFELAGVVDGVLAKHGVEKAYVRADTDSLHVSRTWVEPGVRGFNVRFEFKLPQNLILPKAERTGAVPISTPTEELYAFMAACMEIRNIARDEGLME